MRKCGRFNAASERRWRNPATETLACTACSRREEAPKHLPTTFQFTSILVPLCATVPHLRQIVPSSSRPLQRQRVVDALAWPQRALGHMAVRGGAAVPGWPPAEPRGAAHQAAGGLAGGLAIAVQQIVACPFAVIEMAPRMCLAWTALQRARPHAPPARPAAACSAVQLRHAWLFSRVAPAPPAGAKPQAALGAVPRGPRRGRFVREHVCRHLDSGPRRPDRPLGAGARWRRLRPLPAEERGERSVPCR